VGGPVVALVLALGACAPTTGSAREVATNDAQAADPPDGLVSVELATVGVDAAQRTPVVLLRESASGKIVPIWVGVPEAQAILRTMLGVDMPRPMTHDLLASVIRELGATVEEVAVHSIQETTFIGRIRLRLDDQSEPLDIDSRPSDALALAIRTDAPIFVAEALLADPPDFDFLAPEADEQVVRILGVTVVNPTPVLRERFDLGDRPGVVAVGVSGEAAERGLRRGDLIVTVNGVAPAEPMDFLNAVLAAEDVVEIVYWRGGEEHRIELSPAPAPGRAPTPEGRRAGSHIQA
jgi:uncharacterized protein